MQARRSSSPSVVPDVGAGSARRQQPVEYKVLAELPEPLESGLNALGDEGWQLVATAPAFIFRRPKIEDGDGLRARVGFAAPRD